MSGSFTQPLLYFFGQGRADGTAAMKDQLGGKGAGLAEMTTLGIPVPPGFTIATSVCNTYLESRQFTPRLRSQVEHSLQRLEAATGKQFGGADHPLLVSVRSGAPVSMPGMMETILNLGLNETTVAGLAAQSGNAGFAWDSYRRFVQMYAAVVFDLPRRQLEERLDAARRESGVERDIELPTARLQALVHDFKDHVKRETGSAFPDDPLAQLWGAIAAVFESWNTRRAQDYRKLHGIPEAMGTAVNVVAMVFGNLGEDSGTGVAFTRDPSTGEARLYGEYLLNAQGEDVVSGSRTPEPIPSLRDKLPHAFQELERTARILERHFRDVQDLEFTIERGRLYMLQTRGLSGPARPPSGSPATWSANGSSRRRKQSPASRPGTWTSCSTPRSTRPASSISWPWGCPRRRAPPAGPSSWTRTSPNASAGPANRSSSCAGRRPQRTFTAWWSPRPCSRRGAA